MDKLGIHPKMKFSGDLTKKSLKLQILSKSLIGK
jgi:hypothetical protein